MVLPAVAARDARRLARTRAWVRSALLLFAGQPGDRSTHPAESRDRRPPVLSSVRLPAWNPRRTAAEFEPSPHAERESSASLAPRRWSGSGPVSFRPPHRFSAVWLTGEPQ